MIKSYLSTALVEATNNKQQRKLKTIAGYVCSVAPCKINAVHSVSF